MERRAMTPRPDWREKASEAGFDLAPRDGSQYWDESSAYIFAEGEIEAEIAAPAENLHAMCREAVDTVCRSERMMEDLEIPEAHRDLVAGSFLAGEPELYGRFDFCLDGTSPAKLLEYNADTPVALFEAAEFQCDWYEDQLETGGLPAGSADQFSETYEALVRRFAEILAAGATIHFIAMGDAESNPEDYAATECLAWAARDAGLVPRFLSIDRIGVTRAGRFADEDGGEIDTLFKMYPWEDMLRDPFAPEIAGATCRMLEPAWKAIVSNKGFLAILWELFEGHPNLLPAAFVDGRGNAAVAARARAAMTRGVVTKPIFSRQSAGVEISRGGLEIARSGCAHPGSRIAQAYHPLPDFSGHRPVLGAWMVGRSFTGLGILEDRGPITGETCRFKPHAIMA